MADLSPDRQPDPAASIPAADSPVPEDALLPVPVAVAERHDGWTAARQRTFIHALAETGCVTQAAAEAGMSVRSAYRLRARADATAFDRAWTHALFLASHRLTGLAWERAIHGVERGIRHNGERVGTERVPSDRLLMFLLRAVDPFAYKEKMAWERNPRTVARTDLHAWLDKIVEPEPPAPERPPRARARARTR